MNDFPHEPHHAAAADIEGDPLDYDTVKSDLEILAIRIRQLRAEIAGRFPGVTLEEIGGP